MLTKVLLVLNCRAHKFCDKATVSFITIKQMFCTYMLHIIYARQKHSYILAMYLQKLKLFFPVEMKLQVYQVC